MEYTQTPQMDEQDNEIVDILTRTGMARNTAKVFVAVNALHNPDTRQIMQFTGVMQPQISVVIRKLLERDYIKAETEKTEKQGRPIQHYSLKKPISKIINEIEMVVQEKINAVKWDIDRLKTLTENYIYDE